MARHGDPIQVRFREPLKFEQRIEIKDFFNVLLKKDNIVIKGVEVFPGWKVDFRIDDKDFLITSDIERTIEWGLAGLLQFDFVGEPKIHEIKIGDVEENDYEYAESKFLNNADSGSGVEMFEIPLGSLGDYIRNQFWSSKNKKTDLVLKITLYKEEDLQISRKLEIPKALTVQESLPAFNKAIMKDDSTADLTIKCGSKTFWAHKNFMCGGVVLLSSILGALLKIDD